MTLLSLKTHVLVGAILWTIGLFALTGVALHLVTFDDATSHAATHWSDQRVPSEASSRHAQLQAMSRWLFFRHSWITALVGVLSMVLGLLEIRRGMSPLSELRHRLSAIHKGVAARLNGRYPSEVQPLVDDMNALLEDRERRVARAVARAGDLAHALKTPLSVLMHEAQQVRAAGHAQLSVGIDQQIDRMRRHIDYHLTHARSAASAVSPAARAPVAESANGLARTLQRLHIDRTLSIEIDVSESHIVRGLREDLDEMLGNLLDNACKWARTRVKLTTSMEGDRVVIFVEDDGPGIDAAKREIVLQRGIRADETEQGSGLGLAIVRELAEIYGGSISLEKSLMGGLCARLALPAA